MNVLLHVSSHETWNQWSSLFEISIERKKDKRSQLVVARAHILNLSLGQRVGFQPLKRSDLFVQGPLMVSLGRTSQILMNEKISWRYGCPLLLAPHPSPSLEGHTSASSAPPSRGDWRGGLDFPSSNPSHLLASPSGRVYSSGSAWCWWGPASLNLVKSHWTTPCWAFTFFFPKIPGLFF